MARIRQRSHLLARRDAEGPRLIDESRAQVRAEMAEAAE
jgi:hypothetical protein